MDLNTALAQATENGWQIDPHTPSFIQHQISTERDGFLAFVTVRADGAIRWLTTPLTAKARGQRGEAATVTDAIASATNAVTASAETLF